MACGSGRKAVNAILAARTEATACQLPTACKGQALKEDHGTHRTISTMIDPKMTFCSLNEVSFTMSPRNFSNHFSHEDEIELSDSDSDSYDSGSDCGGEELLKRSSTYVGAMVDLPDPEVFMKKARKQSHGACVAASQKPAVLPPVRGKGSVAQTRLGRPIVLGYPAPLRGPAANREHPAPEEYLNAFELTALRNSLQ
eukprot:TRINITY_DN49653_c0_g1_i1.p1 TRINITY_DN49653_c0_g1~~TRINITY_DN49653_c0_g1_i1.p1  ORF type:complete len:220 (-),score=25.08 TRINITY_DN49653_c0_g1_i1:131-724(-)